MRITQILVIAIAVLSMASSKKNEVPKNLVLYYSKFPIEYLRKMALTAESEINRSNDEPLIGGIHDYIFTLDENELALIVAKYVFEYDNFKDGILEKISEVNFHKTFIGLEVFLKGFSAEKLEKIAYGVEAYKRKLHNQEDMTGGLLDVLPYLKRNKESIIRVIFDQIANYEELKNSILLEKLAQHPIIRESEVKSELEETDKATLINFAVTCELYERRTTNKNYRGGLHDYAWSLSREELQKIILTFMRKFPILSGKGFLRRLIYQYKVNLKPIFHGINNYIHLLREPEIDQIFKSFSLEILGEENLNYNDLVFEGKRTLIKRFLENYINHEEVVEKSKIYPGGLQTYITTLGDQVLSNYCCSLESYERKIKNQTLFGGIHDMIKSINKEQKIEYIQEKAYIFNELYVSGKIDSINKEFGGCN